MQKIERLMGIVLALNKNRKMTAIELARKFEVDVRTIYRDINALSELDIPIGSRSGPEGGYTILDKYFIPSISFNKEEIFSLLLSKDLIGKIHIPGYTKYINSAFLKIENAMGDEHTEKLDCIKARIIFDKTNKHIQKKDLKFFEVIKNGIEENKKINIRRISEGGSDIINETVRPFGLIYVDEVWQLIYSCDGYNDYKDVPINWIIHAETLKDTFEIPKDFNINNYYCNNFCMLPCAVKQKEKEYEKTKIKIKREEYHVVKDYLFFHEEDIIEKKDDYVVVATKAIEPRFYYQIAHKFSDSVEILEPKWLRDAIFKEIEKLYKKYKNY